MSRLPSTPDLGNPLSSAQLRALKWLANHKGQATLDRFGRVCDAATMTPSGFQAATFLRLVTTGHACEHMRRGWLGITMTGLRAIGR